MQREVHITLKDRVEFLQQITHQLHISWVLAKSVNKVMSQSIWTKEMILEGKYNADQQPKKPDKVFLPLEELKAKNHNLMTHGIIAETK